MNSIYLNDDFYMMADMVPADFHTTGELFCDPSRHRTSPFPDAFFYIHSRAARSLVFSLCLLLRLLIVYCLTAMGTVLRLEPDLIVGPDVDEAKITPTGEWGPLYYSNQLLSAHPPSSPLIIVS